MLPVFLSLFSFGKLCDEWSEDQEVTYELEAFTRLIYGYVRVKSVSTLRSIILSKVVGENDELTTKSNQSLSLPASILQRQLCPTLFHSELRPC